MSKNEADDRYGPRRMDAETSEPVHAEQPREGTPSPPSGIGVESKRVRFFVLPLCAKCTGPSTPWLN